MAIGFHPPLPPDHDWNTHHKAVKRCRGTVCYGALAAHFGTDSPKTLEWRVDQRTPYSAGEDPSTSNKYRRWRQGLALPHDDTIANVGARTAGGVRLDFWRDLPLWELLAAEPPSLQRLHGFLEGSHTSVRQILFMDDQPDRLGRFHHSLPGRSQTLAIRNLHSLDAFLALLCLARKGEALEDDPHHFVPAECAFDIFPRILYSYRPLRYRWEEGLFSCLHRIYWSRVYLGGAIYDFPIEAVRSNLCLLDAYPAAELPQMSGKRLRDIPPKIEEADATTMTEAWSRFSAW